MDKDELIDIWREVVLKNTTNGSCNFQQAAIDFAELVAKPWVETNKALANEIIELQKQAEQEPDYFGLTHDHTWLSIDKKQYDKLKPEGRMTCYATPVCTKDLTDDEAQKLWNDTSSIVPMWAHHLHFARAVIAADREKNK